MTITYHDILEGKFEKYSQNIDYEIHKLLISTLENERKYKTFSEDEMTNFTVYYVWLPHNELCKEIFRSVGRQADKQSSIRFYEKTKMKCHEVFSVELRDARFKEMLALNKRK